MGKPFEGLAEAAPVPPRLSVEERQMLARLCVPGGALWKILRSGVDFANHMRDHIAALDLSAPEQAALARQLQLKRNAALAFLEFVARATQLSPTEMKDLTQ